MFDLAHLTREDGWKNILTKMGTSKDQQTADRFAITHAFGRGHLAELYRGEGFAKRIVNLPAQEMTRAWFDVVGDPDGDVNSILMDMDAKKKTNKALRWASVYGGAVALMLIDDGAQSLEEPVDEKKIQSVSELRVYDRFQVWWTGSDVEDDPQNPNYGEPKVYTINPITIGITMPTFRVHRSRLLFFDGDDLSEEYRAANNGWGDSIYQSCYKQLSDLSGSYHSARSIVGDFIQAVLSIDNLQDLVVGGKADVIKKRLEILDMSRSVMNMKMIDSKEKYEKVASSITGLSDLLDRFGLALSGVRGIPYTLLMGQSPAGLNSTGKADLTMWYDSISAAQEEKMLRPMETLVRYIYLSKGGPTNGVEPDEWSIEFNSLWQPTEKEAAETRKSQAETDAAYLDRGVVTPGEIAESRFGGVEYSTQTRIQEGVDRDDLLFSKQNPSTSSQDSDDVRNDAIMTTSFDNEHNHYVEIFDGYGMTRPGEGDGHRHEIIDFKVMAVNGHTHTLIQTDNRKASKKVVKKKVRKRPKKK